MEAHGLIDNTTQLRKSLPNDLNILLNMCYFSFKVFAISLQYLLVVREFGYKGCHLGCLSSFYSNHIYINRDDYGNVDFCGRIILS